MTPTEAETAYFLEKLLQGDWSYRAKNWKINLKSKCWTVRPFFNLTVGIRADFPQEEIGRLFLEKLDVIGMGKDDVLQSLKKTASCLITLQWSSSFEKKLTPRILKQTMKEQTFSHNL